MSHYVIVVYYGINVTVWILDMLNINPIISVSRMSWFEYLFNKFPVKPYIIYRTTNKIFKNYCPSFELYKQLKNIKVKYILNKFI